MEDNKICVNGPSYPHKLYRRHMREANQKPDYCEGVRASAFEIK